MAARFLKWTCILWAVLMLLNGGVTARNLTLHAGAKVFSNPQYDSLALVEFSFSLNRHELAFFPVDSVSKALQSRVFAQVTLLDVRGLPVDSSYTYFSARAADSADAAREGIRLFNYLGLMAPEGVYSARLEVLDVVSKRRAASFLDVVRVAPAPADRISISQILLAYSVRSVSSAPTANRRLVRNGLEIVPNPISVYGPDDKEAYVYAEAYNLMGGHAPSDKFWLTLEVLAEDSTVFQSLGRRLSDKPGESSVVAESIDIDGWSSGLYFVRLTVSDAENEHQATAIEPFRIITPEEVMTLVEKSEDFDPYDTLSLKHRIQMLEYRLTPNQRSTLKQLNEVGKKNFLEEYWREYDPDPSTPANEERLKLLRRYEYVNRMFSTNVARDDGWLTGRGRIYMKHGPYDQMEDMHMLIGGETPGSPFAKPLQIWWYYYGEREGNYYIFEDVIGDDTFELVHSNDPNEVYSRDWQTWIEMGQIEGVR